MRCDNMLAFLQPQPLARGTHGGMCSGSRYGRCLLHRRALALPGQLSVQAGHAFVQAASQGSYPAVRKCKAPHMAPRQPRQRNQQGTAATHRPPPPPRQDGSTCRGGRSGRLPCRRGRCTCGRWPCRRAAALRVCGCRTGGSRGVWGGGCACRAVYQLPSSIASGGSRFNWVSSSVVEQSTADRQVSGSIPEGPLLLPFWTPVVRRTRVHTVRTLRDPVGVLGGQGAHQYDLPAA